MTRGLLPPKISLCSPRVRGARSTSPPPARRRGPAPRADSRRAKPSACVLECARSSTRPRPGRQSVRQVLAALSLTFRPAGSPGTEACEERVREVGSLGVCGVSLSPGRSVRCLQWERSPKGRRSCCWRRSCCLRRQRTGLPTSCRGSCGGTCSPANEGWGTLRSAGLQLEPGLSWLPSSLLLSGLPRWFPRPVHAFGRGVECPGLLLASSATRKAAMTRQEGWCTEPETAGAVLIPRQVSPRAFWRALCRVFGQLLEHWERPVPLLEEVLLFSDILI